MVVNVDMGDVAPALLLLLLTWLGVVVVDDLGGVAIVINDVGAWRVWWLSVFLVDDEVGDASLTRWVTRRRRCG